MIALSLSLSPSGHSNTPSHVEPHIFCSPGSIGWWHHWEETVIFHGNKGSIWFHGFPRDFSHENFIRCCDLWPLFLFHVHPQVPFAGRLRELYRGQNGRGFALHFATQRGEFHLAGDHVPRFRGPELHPFLATSHGRKDEGKLHHNGVEASSSTGQLSTDKDEELGLLS